MSLSWDSWDSWDSILVLPVAPDPFGFPNCWHLKPLPVFLGHARSEDISWRWPVVLVGLAPEPVAAVDVNGGDTLEGIASGDPASRWVVDLPPVIDLLRPAFSCRSLNHCRAVQESLACWSVRTSRGGQDGSGLIDGF